MLLAPLAAVALLATACGVAQPPATATPAGQALLREGDLQGWKAVPAEPGVGELVPELSGLRATGRIEAPALVHAGDAARVTTIVFATSADAGRALARGREDGYRAFLEHAFGGAVVGRGPGVGYRLHVTRSSEPGSDTAELYLVHRGRYLAIVELLSANGFPAKTWNRVLALVSSRLSRRTAAG